jgi:hypothetical protein
MLKIKTQKDLVCCNNITSLASTIFWRVGLRHSCVFWWLFLHNLKQVLCQKDLVCCNNITSLASTIFWRVGLRHSCVFWWLFLHNLKQVLCQKDLVCCNNITSLASTIFWRVGLRHSCVFWWLFLHNLKQVLCLLAHFLKPEFVVQRYWFSKYSHIKITYPCKQFYAKKLVTDFEAIDRSSCSNM